MDIGNFDFGTSYKESYKDYIIRIEKQIDDYLKQKGTISNELLEVILSIFEDVTTNYKSPKFQSVYNLLKNYNGREPNISDLNIFVKHVRWRIYDKVCGYERETKARLLQGENRERLEGKSTTQATKEGKVSSSNEGGQREDEKTR